jgi:hypothetical protein
MHGPLPDEPGLQLPRGIPRRAYFIIFVVLLLLVVLGSLYLLTHQLSGIFLHYGGQPL